MSTNRNVFVYDGRVTPLDDPILVAGMEQLGHTTAKDLYSHLETCFQTPRAGTFLLLLNERVVLPRDDALLPKGDYTVASCDKQQEFLKVTLKDETARRTEETTPATTRRAIRWRDGVRRRDKTCCITLADTRPSFNALDVVHIIPRSHYDYWKTENLAQYLNDDERRHGIHSVQNGLLLHASLHRFWDSWWMSINPETMRVTFFSSDGFLQPLLDGRKVTFRSSRAPPLEFLAEHFRQAVLANVRGAGQRALLEYEDEHRDVLTLAGLENGWLDVRRTEPLAPRYDEDEDELFIGCNP